jgi:hypothetical protein
MVPLRWYSKNSGREFRDLRCFEMCVNGIFDARFMAHVSDGSKYK